MIPPTIPIPELVFIGAIDLLFAYWGYRHGLDAIILAALFVLFARLSADTLAVPVASSANIFYGLFEIIAGGKFSRDAMLDIIFGGPNAPPPLIDVKDPNNIVLRLIGTTLFAMIAYVGFKFALQRAGGKDTPIEQIFGAVGGGILGYLCLTFVIERHFQFARGAHTIVIEPSQTPPIEVNAPLIVALVVVLIVFGVQRGKKK